MGPAESGQSAQASLHVGNSPATALFPPGTPTPDPLDPDKTVLVYEGKTPIFVPLAEASRAGPALSGQIRVFSCSETSCWPSTLPVALPLADHEAADLPPAEGAPWWPLFLALRNAALATPLSNCPEPTLSSAIRPHAAPAQAPPAAPATAVPKLNPPLVHTRPWRSRACSRPPCSPSWPA